jgi:hypothetical protein
METELTYIDQSILRLLDKLGAHYPGYDAKRNDLVAEDWCQALCVYGDQVLKKAYGEVIIKFSKRPTLAEFVATCDKIVAGNRSSLKQQAMQPMGETHIRGKRSD